MGSVNRLLMTTLLLASCLVAPVSRAQTGDLVVDLQINGHTWRAGNNLPATSLVPSAYGSNPTACNSSGAPAWEDNCPSDLTYTPAAGTGGYQAFGVGISQVPGGTFYEYIPVLRQEWDYECNCLIWVFDYEYTEYTVAAHAFGRAFARIRFGDYLVNTIVGEHYLSTLALKSASTHPAGLSSIECSPSRIYGFGFDSPCNPIKQNAYIVPRGGLPTGIGTPSRGVGIAEVGYEDKLIIPNPGCPSNYERTGHYADAYQGCFTFDQYNWYSNIPAAYQDTTKFDKGSPYVAGVGTATPAALIAIGAGSNGAITYWWEINFIAFGTHSAAGQTVRHTANITTYGTGYPCIPNSGPLCQFNVDQTNIAPVSPFITFPP